MIRTMDGDTRDTNLARTFAALHNREVEVVLRYLTASVGNAQDAEDLAAETFARAWRHWPRFRELAGSPARNWLLTIARNLAIDNRRRKSRRPEVRLTESVAAADWSSGWIDRMQLNDGIARMRPRDREVVALRASGLAFREVGAALGTSEAAAKMAWQRAARRLQQLLEEK
jgi:RNA polymerase sigma-70 factor (ECF subfamily)